jgi:cytochrome c biogenesis protein CcmG/thiol:disulfide interchange protein DsbE
MPATGRLRCVRGKRSEELPRALRPVPLRYIYSPVRGALFNSPCTFEVSNMKIKTLVPLLVFLVIAVFLGIGLTRDPRKLPSTMIGKPAPSFSVPQLITEDKQFSPTDMKGQVWLLNVWASWCTPCRVEHPILVEIERSKAVPIVGLNHKDKREDALKFLQQLGDPYVLTAVDREGLVSIDYGVYGVPETFVIDREGRVRHRHVGPITPEALQKEILPLIAQLKGS